MFMWACQSERGGAKMQVEDQVGGGEGAKEWTKVNLTKFEAVINAYFLSKLFSRLHFLAEGIFGRGPVSGPTIKRF